MRNALIVLMLRSYMASSPLNNWLINTCLSFIPMAFFRSRTGVSLRADRRSTTSDLSFSLREEPLPPPMISLISLLFWERVKRSMGFSARGSKGQTPRSGSLLRVEAAAATAVQLAAGAPLVAGIAGLPFMAGMAGGAMGAVAVAGGAVFAEASAAEGGIFAADG